MVKETSRNYMPLPMAQRNILTEQIAERLGLTIIGGNDKIVQNVRDERTHEIVGDIGRDSIKVYTLMVRGRELAEFIENYEPKSEVLSSNTHAEDPHDEMN